MPQYLLKIKGKGGCKTATSLAVDSSYAERDVRKRYPSYSEHILDICRIEDQWTPEGVSLDAIEDPATNRVKANED